MFRSQAEEIKVNDLLRQKKDCVRYAYSILYDPIMRKLYDELGYDGLQSGLQISTECVEEKKSMITRPKVLLTPEFVTAEFVFELDCYSLLQPSYYTGMELSSVGIHYSIPVCIRIW